MKKDDTLPSAACLLLPVSCLLPPAACFSDHCRNTRLGTESDSLLDLLDVERARKAFLHDAEFNAVFQFRQRLFLYLTDSLASDSENRSDLFERVLFAFVRNPEPQAHDPLFAGSQT